MFQLPATRLVGVAKCALDSLTPNTRGDAESLQLAVSATSGRLRRQSVLDGNEHELQLFTAAGETAATLRVAFKFAASEQRRASDSSVLGGSRWQGNPLWRLK